MKPNPLNQGVIAENFTGIGSVTPAMVQQRAVELALINGHSAENVSKSDWEQAKRELTGGIDASRREAMFEAVPETERWNPVPGSTGHKAPESPSEDEDDEGRGESQQLVEEGVAEAEHDQMLRAAQDAEKKDQ